MRVGEKETTLGYDGLGWMEKMTNVDLLLIDNWVDLELNLIQELIDKTIKFDNQNPFEFLIENDLEDICINLCLEMFSESNLLIFYPDDFFISLGILV